MKKNFIKTLLVSTMIAGATFFAACDEDTGLVIGIDQTFDSMYEVDPLTGTSINKIDTVSFNLDSVLAQQNATKEDIESIEFKGFSLAITDSAGNVLSSQNFNNFNSINASIAELSTGFTQLAALDSANLAALANSNPLVFPGTAVFPVNLLDFLSERQFRVQINSTLNNNVTTKFYIKSQITVKVNAKL